MLTSPASINASDTPDWRGAARGASEKSKRLSFTSNAPLIATLFVVAKQSQGRFETLKRIG
jgi:hypothetical protein